MDQLVSSASLFLRDGYTASSIVRTHCSRERNLPVTTIARHHTWKVSAREERRGEERRGEERRGEERGEERRGEERRGEDWAGGKVSRVALSILCLLSVQIPWKSKLKNCPEVQALIYTFKDMWSKLIIEGGKKPNSPFNSSSYWIYNYFSKVITNCSFYFLITCLRNTLWLCTDANME